MRAVSNQALRRLAPVVFALIIAVVALRVGVSVAAGSVARGTWGGGGAWVDLTFVAVVFTFPLAGLVILRGEPRNRVGWLLMGIGVIWTVDGALVSYAAYGLVVDPGALPRPDIVAAVNEGTWAPLIGTMCTFLILLFPDGRLPSPRWRWLAWVAATAIVVIPVTIALQPGPLEESAVPIGDNPLGWESARGPIEVVLSVALPLLPLSIIACAVSLILRFRRSHGVERQQVKWLAAAGAVAAVLYGVTLASSFAFGMGDVPPGWVMVMQNFSIMSFVLLPLAIGAAVQRYRLYDIDVVINRALVYGGLTAALGAAYLGSVLVLQVVLSPLTDQSDLAVAGSTLAVAALFGPARRRIQEIVDRRFYRRRYDAVHTLDVFAGRLRHELDLEAVGADLRSAVRETVQPLHVSLWLRERSP